MTSPAQELNEMRAAYRRAWTQLAERDQEVHDLRQQNEELQARLTALLSRMEQITRRVYGASSERHHPQQQSIDLVMPDVVVEAASSEESTSVINAATETARSTATLGAADTDAPAASGSTETAGTSSAAPPRRPRAPGTHPGRRQLPVGTDIVEQDVTIPEHERLDAQGQPLPLIGWRTSDKWDYRPGMYVIRRIRRAQYGRPFSDAHDRIVAPMPAMLIPRGAMTDAALIHTVVEKYADHLPLYRQAARAARSGWLLSRATLVNHIAAVAGAMTPIVDVLGDEVRQSPVIHLDDTPIRLLDPGRGRTATARIWVYRAAEATVFRFTTTREGRHPHEFLGDYRGHIVADGYAGHEVLYGVDRATHVACWAHARRKFSEIKHRSPLALTVVDDIQELYDSERLARLLSDHDRHELRRQRSRPIVTRIGERLTAAAATTVPASDLGLAIAYARNRWPQLCRYLDRGDLPIDNNAAENALRPWAIGRKNWLFIGSAAGGERAAIIATLIENCRQQALDPYRYLCDTVAALHAGCCDYHALTPRAYAATHDRIVAA